jgi:hypothetical protein
MRKTLLLCLFGCLALYSKAQPTLTSAAVGAIGSTYYMANQDTFAPGFSLGGAGASQTWNFQGLWVNGFDTIYFRDPDSTTYASNFPTANLAIERTSLSGGVAYFDVTAAHMDLLGLAGDLLGTGNVTVITQNPATTVAAFPYTYQNQFAGITVIDVTVDASGFGIPLVDSARYKNIQDKNTDADAWGTLVLPTQSYANVLRTKEVNHQTDSIWIHTFFGWTLYQDSTYTDSTFTWWNNSKGYFLAQASYIGGALNEIDYQDYLFVGKPELNLSNFSVYPNPARERLFIDTDGKNYDLQVTDILGRKLLTQSLRGPKTEIDLTGLPEGLALYAILGKGGEVLQSGKLIIEQ